MSVMVDFWYRAGEQGCSGVQGGAAGNIMEVQGEGHGERRGDTCGDIIGDAAFEEHADFDKMEDFSQELDLEGSFPHDWFRTPGHMWCPELGRLRWGL